MPTAVPRIPMKRYGPAVMPNTTECGLDVFAANKVVNPDMPIANIDAPKTDQ